MKQSRWIIAALLALAVIALPLSAAGAQGPYYYCSATRTSGGSGTFYDPWACSTDAQLSTVANTICRQGGGTLYRIYTGFYVVYTIRLTATSGNMCELSVGQQQPGYPPNTGVGLPGPVLYAGMGVVGLALIAAGWWVRRSRRLS